MRLQGSIAPSERGLPEEALPQGKARTLQLQDVAHTRHRCALDQSWDPCMSPAVGTGLSAHTPGM